MSPFPRSCAARFTATHALAHGRWLAFEPSANRGVVVRLVRHPGLARYGAAAQFADEQERRAALVHPHLTPVLAFGVEEDVAWVATPYRAGPEGADLATLIGVARGLHLAHDAGLVHDDIGPSNILAGALTDFGLARWAHAPRDPDRTAPEVLAGAPPTPRSDIYALGAMLGACAPAERACCSEPGARFPSAAALADALERLPGALFRAKSR